jgi:tRNA-(ms[2]io[6]A)-hydroxylase
MTDRPLPPGRTSEPAALDPADAVDGPPATLDTPAITRAARLSLSVMTPREWAPVAVADISTTLLDHAWCEKKAAATCMSFISRYPGDAPLVRDMIALATEEWEHFELVYGVLERRGIPFEREERDPYVNALTAITRGPEPHQKLDRLIVSAFIEARSCERFALLAEALPEREDALRRMYIDLFEADARHYGVFIRLAHERYPRDAVRDRVREYSVHEAEVIRSRPLEPRMH